MFEKITLRRSVSGPALTAGDLAEALLFYRNVHVIFNRGTLASLVPSIGAPTIMALFARPGFSAVYCEDIIGTYTTAGVPFNSHLFTTVMFNGSEKIGELHSKEARLRHILERLGVNKKEAKSFARRFLDRAPCKRLSSNYFVDGGVANAALEDLGDKNYIHNAVRIALNDKIQQPIGNFHFEIIRENDNRFYIASDLDFPALNQQAQRYDSAENFTEGHLINEVLEAKLDFILAGHYGSELYTAATSSDIIKLKYSSILRRLEIENDERTNFMDIVVGGKSIKETIDSGEKSFDEFLKLLDSAERFKEWANNINPDDKLVKQYLNEITKKGWLETLPGKVIRYALGNTVGLIAPTTTGLALSAADTFLLDKINLGWRPSHFVDSRLKKFLGE